MRYHDYDHDDDDGNHDDDRDNEDDDEEEEESEEGTYFSRTEGWPLGYEWLSSLIFLRLNQWISVLSFKRLKICFSKKQD